MHEPQFRLPVHGHAAKVGDLETLGDVDPGPEELLGHPVDGSDVAGLQVAEVDGKAAAVRGPPEVGVEIAVEAELQGAGHLELAADKGAEESGKKTEIIIEESKIL